MTLVVSLCDFVVSLCDSCLSVSVFVVVSVSVSLVGLYLFNRFK